MAAGVTRWGFYYQLSPGCLKAPQLIHFPGHLQRQVRGQLLPVWDRLGVHRRRAVRDGLAAQGDRFMVLLSVTGGRPAEIAGEVEIAGPTTASVGPLKTHSLPQLREHLNSAPARYLPLLARS